MDDLDPTTAVSLDDLAACLRHVHLLADKPTYRALEHQTAREGGSLPGIRLRRVRLTRSTLSDVLRGRKFPGKAFLLTFVDACGIDLEKDHRWEEAWDRLAPQYLDQAAEAEAEKLRRQLAAVENLNRQQTLTAEEMAAHLEAVQAQAREAHHRLTEATAAHAAELEQIRADAQARIDEAQASAYALVRRAQADAEALVRAAEADRDQARGQAEHYRQAAQNADQRPVGDVPADQGTLVSRDGSVSRDVPAAQDASAVTDPNREVTVVPGVPRYHTAACVLIRFIPQNELDTMTVAGARQTGCTPCRACTPDQPSGPDRPSQGDHGIPLSVLSGSSLVLPARPLPTLGPPPAR